MHCTAGPSARRPGLFQTARFGGVLDMPHIPPPSPPPRGGQRLQGCPQSTSKRESWRLAKRLSGKCWRLRNGWEAVREQSNAGGMEVTGTLKGGGALAKRPVRPRILEGVKFGGAGAAGSPPLVTQFWFALAVWSIRILNLILKCGRWTLDLMAFLMTLLRPLLRKWMVGQGLPTETN